MFQIMYDAVKATTHELVSPAVFFRGGKRRGDEEEKILLVRLATWIVVEPMKLTEHSFKRVHACVLNS